MKINYLAFLICTGNYHLYYQEYIILLVLPCVKNLSNISTSGYNPLVLSSGGVLKGSIYKMLVLEQLYIITKNSGYLTTHVKLISK